MNASKQHSRSNMAIFGVIATVLLAFGFVAATAFATSAAYADELAAAQPASAEAAQPADPAAAQPADSAATQPADPAAAQPADSSAKSWDLPKDADSTAGTASSAASAKKGANGAALSTQSSNGIVELAGSKLTVQSSADSYQFVLSWGELPSDLDSHVEGYTPNGESIHVYYGNSSEDYSGDTYCTLDHDDVDSYGPETVDLKSSSKFPCYYYVYNFSGSPDICMSQAVVKVYKGGTLVGTKKVPARGTGRYWNICAVQNGKITWYDEMVDKASITNEPNLSYLSFSKWSTTSYGKRIFPDYGHKYGNLDHFMTSVSGIKSHYPNFATTASSTYPIPGLEYSSVGGGCDAAVPQGVCVTDNHIVVTAYCAGDLLKNMSDWSWMNGDNKKFVKNELQKHCNSGSLHNPALYVLDKSTGGYVATVEIKGIGHNHVGGIAYGGGYLWVATSTETDSKDNYQELMIPINTFNSSLSAGDNASVSVSAGDAWLISLPASGSYINSASYNAYDSETDTLWVGNNAKGGSSSCRAIAYKWNGSSLQWKGYYNIPSGGNGMAVAHSNNRTYLLLGVSKGRAASSTLYRWDITNRDYGFTLNSSNAGGSLELPPMLEELCVDGDNFYSVYESGATVYGCFDPLTRSKSGEDFIMNYDGRPDVSVDVICQAPVSNILTAGHSSKVGKANKTRISVACPVTVELLDAEGEVVGKIYDGWVDDDYLGEGVCAWIDGDVKSFLVPSDQQYSINIIATDDGSMDVTAVQYDDEGLAESTVTYDDVALVSEGSHNATLATLEGEAAVSTRFALIGSEGDALDPSEVVDEGVEMCQVNTVVEGEGIVTESVQVARGDYHVVTATPEEGWHFDGWYVGNEQVCADAEYDFWVTGDIQLVARFTMPDYAMSNVSVEGNGSISTYDPETPMGEGIYLQAIPDEDGWFDGWYLNGELESTSEYFDFYSDEDSQLVAKFKPAEPARVRVEAGGNGLGEVELLSSDGKVGGTATVSAYAHNRTAFEGWHVGSADGKLVSTDEEYSFTIEGDTVLVANFVDAPVRYATVTLKTIGSGTVKVVSGDGAGEAAGDGDDAGGAAGDGVTVTTLSIPIEDELTLTAVPNDSDEAADDGDESDDTSAVSFTGWSYNGTKFGHSSQTWTIMDDVEIVAWFSDANITVTAQIVGDYEDGEISLSPTSANVTSPDPVEFSVDYDYDYYDFLGWYRDGELISENSWLQISPTENMNLEAHVRKASFANVQLVYDSMLGGVWDADDFDEPVRVGSTYYLEAYTYYYTVFDGWYLDGKLVSTSEYYAFKVTGDARLEARFSEMKEDISGATVSGVSSYTYDGKAKQPVPTVKYDGYWLDEGWDYTISYENNKNAGKATLIIKGIGYYTGTIRVPFTINKAKQPMTAKAAKKKVTVKRSKVKKKAFTVQKPITVRKNQGTVTFANASAKKALKKFKVNAKNGTIKVPKGTKKGTYKVKVKVTAKGNGNYASGYKLVTVKIVVS